jgi:hypothetical protein
VSNTATALSEREQRQLVLLKIRLDEGYRAFRAPEHDADAWAGLVWYSLGAFWRPGEWELSWTRTESQSWSHTFRRLRAKGYVGCHDGPQQVFGDITLDPSSYYYFTGDGHDIAASLKVPADLARRCGYSSCERWLPPNERRPVCTRCRFGRKYREEGRYKNNSKRSGSLSESQRSRRGPGFEEFVKGGWSDVTDEVLLSRDHAAKGMGVARVLLKAGEPGLLDSWRQHFADKHLPSPDELDESVG